MNIKGSIYSLANLISIAMISNFAQADQFNSEKATQLLVCASAYQLAESMLLVPGTGKSSDAARAEMLHNKQEVFVRKAVQASSHDFVTSMRQRVTDRLVDRTMDEYAVLIKNKKISYTDFLLMKFDAPCASQVR